VRAYRAGTLASNRYHRVVQTTGCFQILPASPQCIYLCFYDPDIVFGTLPNGQIGAARPYVGNPGWLGGPIVGRLITIRTTIIYPPWPIPVSGPSYPRRSDYARPAPGATTAPTGGLPRPASISMPEPRLQEDVRGQGAEGGAAPDPSKGAQSHDTDVETKLAAIQGAVTEARFEEAAAQADRDFGVEEAVLVGVIAD
jgi:hypothetical protein